MPSYIRDGSLPHKRHIQFRRPDGGLYAEELFSTKGFENVYSLLYHLRPPTATLDVREWERPSVRLIPNEPLRNRHFKMAHVETTGDAIESRRPLLGNDDLLVSIANADKPMEYWYRNTGGDELLFIHHGAGVVETNFGELAYRANDYIIMPTGTTYRLIPSVPTRILVHESTGMVKIPRKYRNEYGQLEEHAPYYERDFRAPVLKPPVDAQGEYEVRVSNAGPQCDLHRAESSVRRCRLGRLLLPVRVQSRRVRADHRKTTSAAAGSRHVRSARRRVLRLRSAIVRLSSARDSGAVQSLERRLRRSLILRQR